MSELKSKEMNIYVLNLGWVIVGMPGECSNDSKILNVSNSSVIRRWGTSKGLGELALMGPLEDTILDLTHDLKINTDSIIMILKCNPEKWALHFNNNK